MEIPEQWVNATADQMFADLVALVEQIPHSYECAMHPPSWAPPEDQEAWDFGCDCPRRDIEYVLTHGSLRAVE